MKVKIVYTDHMGHKKAHTFLKKMARLVYYHINAKLFDYGINTIVCVSDFVENKYYREYKIKSKKLYNIYNGINTKRFKKIRDTGRLKEKYKITDEFVVSCISIKKEKGAHCLIEAAPRIVKEFPKTKIYFSWGRKVQKLS